MAGENTQQDELTPEQITEREQELQTEMDLVNKALQNLRNAAGNQHRRRAS
jgi:hypothetical protein